MNMLSRTFSLAAMLGAGVLMHPASAQTFGPSTAKKTVAPAKTVTVEQAKALADDVDVVLEGRITQQIRNEHYRFEDASGWVEVEIDDDDWNGVTTDAEQSVRLIGEVDKDRNSLKIDVDRVERP